jgi:hypothetical protein
MLHYFGCDAYNPALESNDTRRFVMDWQRSLAPGVILITLSGCSSIATPDWINPGSAQAQQTRALRYDPYPDNEAGPAMVGVRPREYEIPPPEPSRARWYLGNWGQ